MRNSGEIVLMDFSGIYEEEQFWKQERVSWVSLQEVSGTNCYCDEEAMKFLKKKIADYSPNGIHFLDSGNYHYMSRIWIEKIGSPFGLVVFDNHTDMQPPAFGGLLSCGGWIASSIEELPNLTKVILIGPDEEAWKQTNPVIREKVCFISRECLAEKVFSTEKLRKYLEETDDSLPFYISVDKDVLCPGEAYTSWSQGDMTVEVMLEMLDMIWEDRISRGNRIIGADICGECDTRDTFQSYVNDEANRRILTFFKKKERHNEK